MFCDVGQDWNITATEVARCVTPRTGAIIVVHTFGIAADVAQLQEFGVPVIEDCCQSLGLQLPNGEHVGHQGYASFFSFHATKSLTTGEGGAVATSDPQLLSNLKRLRDADVHAPLSDLQAALGLSQLTRYPAMLERRQTDRSHLPCGPARSRADWCKSRDRPLDVVPFSADAYRRVRCCAATVRRRRCRHATWGRCVASSRLPAFRLAVSQRGSVLPDNVFDPAVSVVVRQGRRSDLCRCRIPRAMMFKIDRGQQCGYT